MKNKKKNKKKNRNGFTLTEILVVIVVLALLIGLAIPIVSGQIHLSKKRTLVSISSTVIDSVKDDLLANDFGPGYVYYLNTGCYDKITYEKLDITDRKTCLKSNGVWHQYSINDLLDKDMINSPFGNKFLEESYVEVTDKDKDGKYEYNVCITDGKNGIYGTNDNLDNSFGSITSCTAPEDDKFNTVDNLDESGANKPVLPSTNHEKSNLIAVYYDEGVWKKADSNNKKVHYEWYDYDAKKWANAVTVKEEARNKYLQAGLGTEIKISDINSMWVWIPRFNSNGVTSNSNAINITFVDKTQTAHEAFTFGSQNLDGIWVGKFENSSDISCTAKGTDTVPSSALGEDCNLISIKPLIIPSVTSWRGAMVSTYFNSISKMTDAGNIYGFNSTYDTHMMKNSEWGAVAYLTHSIYGRCTTSTSCTEVGINNHKNYFTGYGAPAGSKDGVKNDEYNTSLGIDASTTGNVYGVYDMAGGAEEYVMGVYSEKNVLWAGYSTSNNWHSGFNGYLQYNATTYLNGITFPSNKYYDLYQIYVDQWGNMYFYEELDYQVTQKHALTETKNWYSDQSNFINTSAPWFVRGGRNTANTNAGIFSYHRNYGNGTIYYGSRSVLVK